MNIIVVTGTLCGIAALFIQLCKEFAHKRYTRVKFRSFLARLWNFSKQSWLLEPSPESIYELACLWDTVKKYTHWPKELGWPMPDTSGDLYLGQADYSVEDVRLRNVIMWCWNCPDMPSLEMMFHQIRSTMELRYHLSKRPIRTSSLLTPAYIPTAHSAQSSFTTLVGWSASSSSDALDDTSKSYVSSTGAAEQRR